MPRRALDRRAGLAWGLVALAALALDGCASRTPAPVARQAPPCAFTTCKTDPSSLAQVTAKEVGAKIESVDILAAEPQFGGSVVVWRASVAGKRYLCKEGRNADTGVVHYVACQPSNDTGPLQAFH